ncbi:MAG: transposase [Candidatus Nanoarchaeia archaeon]
MAIDGSGVDSYYQSSYHQKRLSNFGVKKQNSSWHKFDIIIDVKSKLILDFSFLLHNRHDSKVAWQLFNRFKLKNVLILADKGYYWFKLHRLIKQKRGILVVPPKNYGKNCLHNRIVRREFHNSYYEYEEFYTLRNNIESVFKSLK